MSEEDTSKLRILSVGSNAISAFISWRLSESKACHTTLIWRNRCESVLSEGIRIRSSVFGSTKWKPDVGMLVEFNLLFFLRIKLLIESF